MSDNAQKVSVNGAFCGVVRTARRGSEARALAPTMEVLMVRNERGYYELPGGGIEDEHPHTCAARETNEEAGVFIAPERLVRIGIGVQLVPPSWITEKVNIFSNLVILYRAHVDYDVPIRTHDVENTGTRWMFEDEIIRRARAKEHLEPDMIPIVQARMALRTLYPKRWGSEFFLRTPLSLDHGRTL